MKEIKKYWFFLIIFSAILLTTSCTSHRNRVLNGNLVSETWMHNVETSPIPWARFADNWFVNGGPTPVDIANREAPPNAVISNMSLNVPDFTNIKVKGDFQVQIVGTDGPNKVNISGPNVGIRQIIVEMRGQTLCLRQIKRISPPVFRVIVRISINCLTGLMQYGNGSIEGQRLRTNGLIVMSRGRGNIFLSGDLQVKKVINEGKGSINLFGVNSPCLDVVTSNCGMVNLSGHMVLRTVIHKGSTADINIIGAYGGDTTVLARGEGKISITGDSIRLREVRAKDKTCVYIYAIESPSIFVRSKGFARIGLAGYTNELTVQTAGSSTFFGRNLCVKEATVRALDSSHINIAVSNRMFGAGSQNASIYYFGPPGGMVGFAGNSGVILPIWSPTSRVCTVPPKFFKAKVIEMGERSGARRQMKAHVPAQVFTIKNKPYFKPYKVAPIVSNHIVKPKANKTPKPPRKIVFSGQG